MAPSHFSLLKEKLSAHLVEIATFEQVSPGSKLLIDRLHRVDYNRRLHIFRAFTSKAKRAGHFQEVINSFGRICVDRERTSCLFGIKGDQIWLTMTNDHYLRWCFKLEQCLWCYGR